ncbi:MAG: chemotaxis protein CheA [Spirochaetes bacterium]|nr:chemotaxis protein CheA [Spirochaetota bacterium]
MSGGNFDLSDAVQTFFIESSEKLDEIDSCLLRLEKDSEDYESINELFRAVHTIKGSSGMFGFDNIEEFTHVVENILDRVRNKECPLDHDLISLLFECRDCIKDLVDIYEEDGGVLNADLESEKNNLTRELNKYLNNEMRTASENKPAENKNENILVEGESNVSENENWHISLRFDPDIFKHGFDPFSFISYLNEIGEIVAIRTIDENIPSDDEMDPEKCYLGFEITFKGNVKKETIEDVFDFIIDDCQLRIIPPRSAINDYLDLIKDLPESSMQLGELLVSIGSLTRSELEEALRKQNEQSGDTGTQEKKHIGDIIIEENMVSREILDAALERQQTFKKIDIVKKNLIKINADKVDNLINLVGELIITGSNIKQLSEKNHDDVLSDSVITMTRLIEDIRDSTMNIRMVPIGETFRKFERTVRDLSRENGKDVELVINGGDTELDKSLIDKLSDPLMHLVRNAVDHGIDTPEERLKKGKNKKGTVYLNAYYETGNIVIEIEDDGNGLNRDKIYKKALSSGLIQENSAISDSDLYQFIFEPGFSTAEKITNISGRGVGMDVVRKNIEALRGTIFLDSDAGEGTLVRIYLPLTLAIIDGFLVQVAGSYYVIPLDMVLECSEVSKKEVEGSDFIDLRGELLPFIRLRQYFNVTGELPEKENVVVVEYAQKMIGIVIDKPVGELKTVIKPLGKVFRNLKWISGGTILGSGAVALILDIQNLIQTVEKSSSTVRPKEAAVKK